MNHLEKNCEGIDASVFSSDMLFDDEQRAMLKTYLGRWQRAVDEHERLEAGEQPGPVGVPANVMAALDRMCQPLHESRLSGETAAADARCMEVIRKFVLAVSFPMSDALRDVVAERRRQVEVKGWTPDHDDEHNAGDIACAGASYALAAGDVLGPYSQGDAGFTAENPPSFWPSDWRFKPSDPRRMLVKATALTIAELERFDRTSPKVSG